MLEPFKINIPGLDNMLYGEIPFLEGNRGRKILIMGAPGTGKTILGLQILARQVENGRKGIFVTLQDDANETLYSAEKLFPKVTNWKSIIRTFRISTINDIKDMLLKFIADEAPICVILDGFSVLELKEKEAEDLKSSHLRMNVLDMLNSLCEKKVMVFLIVECSKPDAPEIFMEEYISDIVIKMYLEIFSRQKRHRIQSIDSQEMSLEFLDSRQRQRYIEITKSRGMKSQTGKQLFRIDEEGGIFVFPVPLQTIALKLFYENMAEKQIHEHIKNELQFVYPNIQIDDFTKVDMDTVFDSIQFGNPFHDAEVRIVCIDEFWIKKIWKEKLINIGELKIGANRKFKDTLEEEYLPETMENLKSQCDGIYAVPYYLDVGFFCYRKDILERYGCQPPDTWCDLIECCKEVQNTLESKKEEELKEDEKKIKYGLTFEMWFRETFQVTMLEFLWSNGVDFTTPQDIDWDRVKKTLEFLHSVIWKHKITPYHRSEYSQLPLVTSSQKARKEFIKERPSAIDFFAESIFSRQWYSNLIIGLEENPELDGKIGIMPIPKFPDMKESYSAKGDWFLAILKGSYTEIGLDIIKELTSPAKARMRTESRAGLPVRTDFYDDIIIPGTDKTYNDIRDIYKKSRARSGIYGYPENYIVFFRQLRKYLQQEDEKSIDLTIEKMKSETMKRSDSES